MNYTFERELTLEFDDAVESLHHQIRQAEFEIVSTIKLSDFIKAEIGEEIPRCLIVGVLPPALTYEAICIERKLVSVLPFNIILEQEESGACKISSIDPEKYTEVIKNPAMNEIIKKIRMLIKNIIEKV